MAYKLAWYVPERVIYLRISGTITLDDLARISDELIVMLNTGKPLVHILRDERDSTSTPRNLKQAQSILRAGNHHAIGWVVATDNTHSLAQFLMGMMVTFFGLNYCRFKIIHDGITFLQAQDSSVRWDNADSSLVQDNDNNHHEVA